MTTIVEDEARFELQASWTQRFVLTAPIAAAARALTSLDPLQPDLRAEMLRLREQLTALRKQTRAAG